MQITEVSDNRREYAEERIPKFAKLEITFRVENTEAKNLQFPFDEDPPSGVEPAIGISVDAFLSPDNWKTIYKQPAFLYQDFRDEVRGGQQWFYPTADFCWKVRFAPSREGLWQYRIVAEDAGGLTESEPVSFSVVPSSNHGFVRVSPTDPRYFEFDDGTYFPALGYNMNYDHVSWRNPVQDNEENFRIMGQNGIQLIRIWLSQWAIYGSEWTPWNSQNPTEHGAYIPASGITFEEAYPGSEVSMEISTDHRRCMFIGLWKARPALKRATEYSIQIRYRTQGLSGAVDPSKPFGLVAKTGDWLWGNDESERCYSPDTGEVVTPYVDWNSEAWATLKGTYRNGDYDFLPNFFLVLENSLSGSAFIDFVSIREDLGNGMYGPNIVSKPWMAHHLYFEQRNSYAFDQLLVLAKRHNVYLRPVIQEKNDGLFSRIDFAGEAHPEGPNPDHFYGDWRKVTKVRWLQQAWWRYLQARWGYSTQIHSWELLNEGDPFNSRHYTLADELGKYMRQFGPNHHLVATSTWHSLPARDFWENPEYSHVDFADIHLYVGSDQPSRIRIDNSTFTVTSSEDFFDTAALALKLNELVRPYIPNKPIVRGETGLVLSGSGPADPRLEQDTEGVWLHNFIWAGLHSGGLIESYWYESAHIYNGRFDHRKLFRPFSEFLKGIPLSNGHYQEIDVEIFGSDIRVLGQKDLVNGRAHLWIQNSKHTWRNRLNRISITPVSGSIALPGFQPKGEFKVEWWDTRKGEIRLEEPVRSDHNGTITLTITELEKDTAITILPASKVLPAPSNLRIRMGRAQ